MDEREAAKTGEYWVLQNKDLPSWLMKNSIPQNQEPVDNVKKSLELKFILFDNKYCAIILLKQEIITWYKTNNSTSGLLSELKIKFGGLGYPAPGLRTSYPALDLRPP